MITQDAPATSQPKPILSARLVRVLFPPLGILSLWRDPRAGFFKRIFGTIWILVCTALYFGIGVALCYQFFGLKLEWRGGGVPAFTWRKTLPNYDKLEASRRASTQRLASASQTPSNTNCYWTDFRGPQRDGSYTQQPIAINWSRTGPRLLWRQPIGGGYASFVVANGHAYTIELRRKQEAVTCYDVSNGQEIWAHAYDAWFQEEMGGDGPRATPTYRDGRIYSMGALGDLACLEADSGRLIWKKNVIFDNDSKLLHYGIACSPLILGDQVIVLAGGPGVKTVASYDRLTGGRLWNALADIQGYSSPVFATLAGQPQVLVLTGTRLVGLDPKDGGLQWEYPWPCSYDNNIAQPVILNSNRVLVSSGYGTGCALLEIARAEKGLSPKTLWKNKNLKNKFSSSVFWDGYIYGLDEDMLVCINPENGQREWKEGRYGYGQLLVASGHLIILCGNGDLALVKADPRRCEEVARCPGIRGKTWNHPAIAEGHLLVRNGFEMACFDLAVR